MSLWTSVRDSVVDSTGVGAVADALGIGSKSEADSTAQDRLSTINREQLDFYNENYRPLEDKLKDMALNPDYTGNYNRGMKQVDNAFSTAEGKQSRTLARYGIQQTGARRTSSLRKRKLAKSLAMVGTKNALRTSTYNQSEKAKQALLGIGTDTQRKAQGLFEASATAESNRNNTNRQIDAQNKANTIGLATTIGAAVAM